MCSGTREADEFVLAMYLIHLALKAVNVSSHIYRLIPRRLMSATMLLTIELPFSPGTKVLLLWTKGPMHAVVLRMLQCRKAMLDCCYKKAPGR